MHKEFEVIKEKYKCFTKVEQDEILDIINSINWKLRNICVGAIELSEYDIDEVIEIFNKINTQGKKLTMFEIINSKWHSIDIDLEYEFVELIQYAENKGFGEIDNQIPLDSLFLVMKNNNEPIITGTEKLKYDVKTNKEYIEKIMKKFKESFKASCDFLKKHNFNYKTIPSKIIMKWLTYLFFNMNEKISNNMSKIILKYIYLISINQVYSNSTHTQLKMI